MAAPLEELFDADDFVPNLSKLNALRRTKSSLEGATERRSVASVEVMDDVAELKKLARQPYLVDLESDLAAEEVCLKRAAFLGDAEAQVDLAFLYESWPEGPRFEDAVKYHLLAAEQRNENAYRALAKLHFHGFGVLEDPVAALRYLALAGESKTDTDRRYLNRIHTLAAAKGGDPAAMYTMGLWYSVGEKGDTDGWYEYNIEKDVARGTAWIEKAAEAGFAIAIERLRQMDSPKKIEGLYIDAGYGKRLNDVGDSVGATGVLWFEKMQGDFESQDILTSLEEELVGDKHEPDKFITAVMRRIYEMSVVRAAADDEWHYDANEYFVVYTEYFNSEGAMAAAESVFRTIRSALDRFFLVQQPDQTWVVVHQPPNNNEVVLTATDTIQEMCDRLLKEDVGWDEETGQFGDEEYLYCEALDRITKNFLQTGGDLRVTWRSIAIADDPIGAVRAAVHDLSQHRENHQFITQSRGFRESMVPAKKFTLTLGSE